MKNQQKFSGLTTTKAPWIENAKKELLRQHDYDFRVQNDELEKAYQDLLKVVQGLLKG